PGRRREGRGGARRAARAARRRGGRAARLARSEAARGRPAPGVLVADRVIEAQPHRSKFVLAYFLLAAIVGVAVAVFGVLAFSNGTVTSSGPGGDGSKPAAWNGWRPSGFVADQVHLIALHVSSTYHLSNARPLVAV